MMVVGINKPVDATANTTGVAQELKQGGVEPKKAADNTSSISTTSDNFGADQALKGAKVTQSPVSQHGGPDKSGASPANVLDAKIATLWAPKAAKSNPKYTAQLMAEAVPESDRAREDAALYVGSLSDEKLGAIAGTDAGREALGNIFKVIENDDMRDRIAQAQAMNTRGGEKMAAKWLGRMDNEELRTTTLANLISLNPKVGVAALKALITSDTDLTHAMFKQAPDAFKKLDAGSLATIHADDKWMGGMPEDIREHARTLLEGRFGALLKGEKGADLDFSALAKNNPTLAREFLQGAITDSPGDTGKERSGAISQALLALQEVAPGQLEEFTPDMYRQLYTMTRDGSGPQSKVRDMALSEIAKMDPADLQAIAAADPELASELLLTPKFFDRLMDDADDRLAWVDGQWTAANPGGAALLAVTKQLLANDSISSTDKNKLADTINKHPSLDGVRKKMESTEERDLLLLLGPNAPWRIEAPTAEVVPVQHEAAQSTLSQADAKLSTAQAPVVGKAEAAVTQVAQPAKKPLHSVRKVNAGKTLLALASIDTAGASDSDVIKNVTTLQKGLNHIGAYAPITDKSGRSLTRADGFGGNVTQSAYRMVRATLTETSGSKKPLDPRKVAQFFNELQKPGIKHNEAQKLFLETLHDNVALWEANGKQGSPLHKALRTPGQAMSVIAELKGLRPTPAAQENQQQDGGSVTDTRPPSTLEQRTAARTKLEANIESLTTSMRAEKYGDAATSIAETAQDSPEAAALLTHALATNTHMLKNGNAHQLVAILAKTKDNEAFTQALAGLQLADDQPAGIDWIGDTLFKGESFIQDAHVDAFASLLARFHKQAGAGPSPIGTEAIEKHALGRIMEGPGLFNNAQDDLAASIVGNFGDAAWPMLAHSAPMRLVVRESVDDGTTTSAAHVDVVQQVDCMEHIIEAWRDNGMSAASILKQYDSWEPPQKGSAITPGLLNKLLAAVADTLPDTDKAPFTAKFLSDE